MFNRAILCYAGSQLGTTHPTVPGVSIPGERGEEGARAAAPPGLFCPLHKQLPWGLGAGKSGCCDSSVRQLRSQQPER